MRFHKHNNTPQDLPLATRGRTAYESEQVSVNEVARFSTSNSTATGRYAQYRLAARGSLQCQGGNTWR